MVDISTTLVSNPYKANSPCVTVFGVDTPELVDSYNLSELEEIIWKLQEAASALRAAKMVEENYPTLFD